MAKKIFTSDLSYIIDAKDENNFWNTQDPAQYVSANELDYHFTNLKPSTKIITLRVPEHLLTNLKLIANKRDIPYQSLLKFFLQEKVNEELQTPFLKLRRKVVRKTLMTALALGLVSVLSYSFFVQPIHAEGISMAPNYHADTFYLLNKLIYKIDEPQRGDVVVFASPTQSQAMFFKRIVGMPGERVSLRDGAVLVNGQVIDEPYVAGETDVRDIPEIGSGITVPANSYYVLGDNRSASIDSRDFGFVVRESIVGKVASCYWNCH